nr:hypothetical protein [Desulfosarcina cetonica]
MKKWVLILAAAILFSASLSQAADPLPRVQLSTSMGDIVVELNGGGPQNRRQFSGLCECGVL